MQTHRFSLRTLIDITDTGIRSDASTANYASIINGMSLHFQPIIANGIMPRMRFEDPARFGFAPGSAERMTWILDFAAEGAGAVMRVEIAIRALNGTPVAGDRIYDSVVTRSDTGRVNLVIEQAGDLPTYASINK